MTRIPFFPLDPIQPWRHPDDPEWLSFTRAIDGGPSRLATACTLFYDATSFYAHFRFEDDEIVANMLVRDDPIYEEDVLELFLSTGDRCCYYEFQISPLGTLFDARVHSPEGQRATMTADRGWNCEGLWGSLKRERSRGSLWLSHVVLAVPFDGIGARAAKGDTWYGNLFRIDRGAIETEFLAWRPTRRDPPDFHVPAEFDRFSFE